MTSPQYKALEIAIEANAPVILWGEPGIGKTATVKEIVEKRQGYMYTFIASQRDPVDLTGAMHAAMRHVEGNGEVSVTRYSPPEWAVILNEHALLGGFVVLFLDEFSTAPPLMQAACLRLLHERMVGDYALDSRIRVILAANPAEIAAYGHDLAPPTANRIVHLDWTLTSDEWAEGILYQGWIPPMENERTEDVLRTRVLPAMAAYVQRTGHLNVRPKSDAEAGRAWPSGRSWAQGAVLMAETLAVGAGDDALGIVLSGSVGASHALEFLGYMRDLDLPDPETIIAEPAKFRRPERQDQLFALLGSVISRVCAKLDKPRNLAAWTVLSMVAQGTDGSDEPRVDLAVCHARTLAMVLQERKDKDKLGDITEYLRPFVPAFEEAGLIPKREKS